VFFDVRGDRYFAVPDRIGVLSDDRRSLVGTQSDSTQIDDLVARGLLSLSPAAASGGMARKRFRRLPTTFAFIASMLWAARAARGGAPLERALAELAMQKHLRAPAANQDMRAAIDEFARRRLWWPRAFVCLFDTLALACYLARRGYACDVVFGAKGRPFAAHCWAEADGRVLVEDPHFCSGFSEMVRV
jgi:hypothetical protein